MRSAASSKTGARRSSLESKFCARGWSLMPRAPASRHARRLLDRLLGQVEADERDQAAARARANASVRSLAARKAGCAVGLVEAEHERAARCRTASDRLEQLVVVAAHAVDVVAEVDVRVEDVGALGQLLPQQVVVLGDQRPFALESVHGA